MEPGGRCTVAVGVCKGDWCRGIWTNVDLTAGRYVVTSLKNRATLRTESTMGKQMEVDKTNGGSILVCALNADPVQIRW